jgi:putative oxidoreductase
MDLMTFAAHGFGLHDLGLAVLRAAVGLFFALSGYHKLFNKTRHAAFVKTLVADKVPAVGFMQWWVAGWEFLAGITLAVGFLTAFSAAVLAVICVVACLAEAPEKVESYHPIDAADVLDDYLYLPEVLYVVMLTVSALAGGGAYSLDALIWS